MTATVFDVQRFSLHDGPGIRTTVFFKGCNMKCLWCHNPESQRAAPELMFYKEKCTGCGACRTFCGAAFSESCRGCGACAAVCAAGAREQSGTAWDLGALCEIALRDLPFYYTSGGGVTLSGGEPLLQPEAAAALLTYCKDHGVHTAVETAGNVPAAVLERILPLTDLLLFDLKGINEALHIKNTGVTNRQILENARLAALQARKVRFRMPYVPGFNDGEAPAVAAFARSLGKELELMAYHGVGAGKYEALGRPYAAKNVTPPTPEYMAALAERLGAVYEYAGV